MVSGDRVNRLVQGAVRAPEETIRAATPEEVEELERRIVGPLPDQLSVFLSMCNGARIGPGGFFGQRPDDPSRDLPTVLELWPEWRAHGWLPFAGDGCGNYYVLRPDGQVGFVDTMADPNALDGREFTDLFACVEWLLENDGSAARIGDL